MMPYTGRRALLAQAPTLVAAIVLSLHSACFAMEATPAADRLVWHLVPPNRYATMIRMTHVVSYDMNGALRTIAGARADATTILEQRAVTLAPGDHDAVVISTIDERRYGGNHPKDPASVVHRASEYKGTMDEQGHCNPSDEPLTDPGDGALSVLPAGPIAAGTTWTFTRRFLVDREMGSGTMSYTDAVARVEDRAGHRVAVINVTGAGRADVAQDLQAKGFRTAAMQLAGVAQFDLTSGLPLLQHYTAHAEWSIRPFGVHIGLIFDDTYDADPFMVKER